MKDEEGDAALRRNKKLNIIHGGLQNAGTDLTAPSFSMFAIRSGADPLMNSLLSSGPALAALIATIPGARFIDRNKEKKHAITLAFMAASRAFYLLLALVPFLPQGSRAPAFIILVALMNLPGSIANTAWQSYIADIIPAPQRPKAFADRNRVTNTVGTIVVLGSGSFLDAMPLPLGYQIAFALAFLVAGAELAVFARIKLPRGGKAPLDAAPSTAEPRAARPRGPRPVAALRSQLALLGTEPEYLKFLAASVAFYFAWQTPWSLFSMYTVDELKASNLWNSILFVINTGGSLLGFGFWARIAERRGNLFVVFHSALPLVIVPFVYALSDSLWPIAAMNLFVGITLSGLILSLFNAMLERCPKANRTTFIAYYNTATMLTAFIAPFWGVALLGFLGYGGAFAVCGAQRMAGAVALFILLRGSRKTFSRA